MSGTRALAPRMIGRQEQLGELDEHLQQARAGSGRLVFVAGEAGVGKTCLVRAFLERARAAKGIEILQGYCYEGNLAVPYGPFVDALRSFLRPHGADTLIRAAGPLSSDLAALLPELALPVASPVLGDPQSQKQRLFEALYRVLRPRPGTAARVLVLEDVHWSDQTSQELLHYLARVSERDPLLLLCTYRTDELHRRPPLTHLVAQLTRDRLYHEVRLSPLSRQELARMLHATLEREVPPDFVAALHDRTGGNPFFVEEILKGLLEEGHLALLLRDAGHARAGKQPTIPFSVKESIRGRTADLDETTATVLSYAAVIGRRFDVEVLLEVTGLQEGDLVRAIERLVARQLVVEEQGDAPARGYPDRYSFRHALSREAVYDDLLGLDRRRKHRAVLRVLEELHGTAEAMVEQLAYHSIQAHDLAKAARYARLAGDRSARLFAFQEAIGHYETALELLQTVDAGERAALLEQLGDAAYPLGDSGRYERYWQEAQTLYAGAGEWLKAGDLACRLGQAAKDRGDMEAAFAHTNAAVAMLEAQPPGHELGMIYTYLANLHRNTTRPREAIAWAETALRFAAAHGDAEVEAEALLEIGVSLWGLGEPAQAVENVERGLARAQSAGVVKGMLAAYQWLGSFLELLGEYKRAGEVLREGMRVAEQHGWAIRQIGDSDLGWVEMELGRWEHAHDAADRAIRAGELGHPYGRDKIVTKAELLVRQGWAERARKLLEEECPPETRVWAGNHRPWAILARAHLALGNPERALAAMEMSARDWHTSQWVVAPADFEWGLGYAIDAWLQVGKPDQAREVWSALAPIAERAATTGTQAYCAQAKGLIAAYEGGHEEAATSFQQAAALWQQQEAPYLEAHARRLRADSLLQTGDARCREDARAELAAAQAICAALGAVLELEAINAAMQRHGLIPKPAPPSTDQTNVLTRREREVLGLIARGYSNRAIAEALVIAEKTAENHVGNILGKLGLASRAQAAAYAVAHGLAGGTSR